MSTANESSAVEHVLVIPTSLLHDLGYFQGFTRNIEKYFPRLLDADLGSYRSRPEMEKDPSFKQLIPYVIFQHRDASGNVSVFAYTRGKGQGESRLHSKRSIGVGGHISSLDASAANIYEQGMQRELDEEIAIDTPYRMRVIGLINDDLTEVGKVHLGVVHLCEVESPSVRPREDEMHEAKFFPLEELRGDLDRFETWSKISFEAIYG